MRNLAGNLADAPESSCAALAQISANERFGKVVDFLRKQIQRDTVVRAL